jgi:hypothetical protein
MSRADMFKQAKEKMDAEKTAKENRFVSDYERPEYTALELKKLKVLRFIGDPLIVRSKPTDPKKVLNSRVVDDKGKTFFVNWSEDRNWILWQVYNTVMAYKWNQEKGVKDFLYAEQFPNLFKRIRWNNKENNAYEKGWEPTTHVVMNCLDRSDMDWHKEHKHYKLLSKKASVGVNAQGEEVTYYETGIPSGCYESIIKTVVEENGVWENFDIAIRKEDDKPFYSIYSAMDSRKIASELSVKMSTEPLTEEELSWELYDLDKQFKVTSYTALLNHLGSFIKEVDACFKKDFFEQLTKLSEDEKAKWAAERADKPVEAEAAPTVTEEPKLRVRTPVAETTKLDFFESAKAAGWKMVDELKSEFGNQIANITIGPDGKDTITYLDEAGIQVSMEETIDCAECGLPNVESIPYCPKCGTKY